MLERTIFVEHGGERWPFAYDLNVSEKIQERWGSFSAFEKFGSKTAVAGENGEPAGTEINLPAIAEFLFFALEEGIEIENEKRPNPLPLPSKKQANRIFSSYEGGAMQLYSAVLSMGLKTVYGYDSQGGAQEAATGG
jgi:hypothetical protein